MAGCSEFVIPVHKGHEIRQKRDFITACFGVNVDFTSSGAAQRTGNEWIKITGPDQARQKAEVFIKGIANPEFSQVCNIPAEIAVNRTWIVNLIAYVQQSCLASVRFLNETQVLLQGGQIPVVQAVSLLESSISNARQSMVPKSTLAYQSQNHMYHAQPLLPPYYSQYPGTSTVHYETTTDGRNAFRNQDVACKGAEAMPSLQNPTHEQVIPKGVKMSGYPEKQPEFATQHKGRLKMSGNLRDYAQKLGYTDEEMDAAMIKFAAQSPNQDPDENSLLQHLIQLFPQKKPTFRSGSESTVVKDSSSSSSSSSLLPSLNSGSSSQVPHSPKEVSSEERDTPKFDASSSNQELRHIVVDGSNVAMSHGNRDVFSCKGIKLCVDYFKKRGHDEITVFVPHWRTEASKPDRPIEDQQILYELENEQILSFTPSRRVNGQRVVCYDDRYIVKLAAENDGIIVSNDNFRDLVKENPEWKRVIEERLLMYTFVKDVFMPPDDPLGRRGPKLDTFLRKGTQASPRLCPYMKKCTYGSKCKFYHPEKTVNSKDEAKNVTDPSIKSPNVAATAPAKRVPSDQGFSINQKSGIPPEARVQKDNVQGSSPTNTSTKDQVNTKPDLKTTQKQSSHLDVISLQSELEKVLPNRSEDIRRVINSNPNEKNLNKLCDMVLLS